MQELSETKPVFKPNSSPKQQNQPKTSPDKNRLPTDLPLLFVQKNKHKKHMR
jgi:hypothetical protein